MYMFLTLCWGRVVPPPGMVLTDKLQNLTFCTADPYQHKSHIGADVRLISCLLTAPLLQAQAMEVGLKKQGALFLCHL